MSSAPSSTASRGRNFGMIRNCRIGFSLAFSVLTIVAVLPSCSLLNLGLIKLRFGCLPEGTRIDTADGSVRIEDLKAGDLVTGFAGSPVRISQIHQYQEDPMTSSYLTVHFDSGSVVSASGKHRIDGVPAASLEIGDACGSQIVTRIDPRHGVARSFDLLTEDAGYRIGGIPVNSMIEEMLGR